MTKNIIITGASTGIGAITAEMFAQNGANVIMLARKEHKLKEIKKKILDLGGKAVYYVVDLRNQQQIEKTVENIKKEHGTPDAIFNVAGVWHNQDTVYAGIPLHLTPIEQINEVFEVSLMGGLILTKLFLPEMVERKQGKIVFLSGTFSNGGAGWIHYYVSKLGVENLTKGLADELRPYNIQVNCICPSDTKTEALERFFPDDAATALDPREIAKLCDFLTSENADNITGQIIVIKNKDVY